MLYEIELEITNLKQISKALTSSVYYIVATFEGDEQEISSCKDILYDGIFTFKNSQVINKL